MAGVPSVVVEKKSFEEIIDIFASSLPFRGITLLLSYLQVTFSQKCTTVLFNFILVDYLKPICSRYIGRRCLRELRRI